MARCHTLKAPRPRPRSGRGSGSGALPQNEASEGAPHEQRPPPCHEWCAAGPVSGLMGSDYACTVQYTRGRRSHAPVGPNAGSGIHRRQPRQARRPTPPSAKGRAALHQTAATPSATTGTSTDSRSRIDLKYTLTHTLTHTTSAELPHTKTLTSHATGKGKQPRYAPYSPQSDAPTSSCHPHHPTGGAR